MVDSGNTYRDKVSRLVSWGHWFSFFNIIAAMLLGTRYIVYSSWADYSLLGQTYQLLTWIGHFGFLVFAVYILIIFPASFLITHEKLMRLFAVLVATVGMTALILDIYTYEALQLHLNPLVWEMLQSGEKSEINSRWQYLFIAVPVIFLLELMISEWVWRKLRVLSRKKLGVPITFVFAASFIASHLVHIWADAFLYTPVTSQRANFPLSYPMTAKSFMEKYGILNPEDYQKRREILNQQNSLSIQYPTQPIEFSVQLEQDKFNLLFVMIDSLRADTLDSVVMPHLHQFALDNTWYKNHFSAGNDAMAGIFGAFYGLPANYAASFRSEGINPVLIDILQQQDYRFGLFSGSNFENPIYFRSIFTQFLTAQNKNIPKTPFWQSDKTAIDQSVSWMKAQGDQPWFAYLELATLKQFEQGGQYDRPFQPALEHFPASETQPAPKRLRQNSYLNAAHFIDEQLQSLWYQLETAALLENTVIVVTANHGYEFNETNTGSWGSNTNYSDYQLQVPLLIHWPNKASSQHQNMTSHLDIAPTLLRHLLHSQNPDDNHSVGTDLFSLSQAKRSLLAGDSKDIVIIQPERTIVVDKLGNYRVFNAEYKLNPHEKPQMSLLMDTMATLQKFYQSEQTQ